MADTLTVKIFNPNQAAYLVFTVVYHPPSSSRCDDDKLIDLLRYIASLNSHIIILGDVELHIDWVNKAPLNSSSTHF